MNYPHMRHPGVHRTWGSASSPARSMGVLRIAEHLPRVPQGGTVLDTGAGVGLGMTAGMYVARPDLRIIALDSGYCDPLRAYEMDEAVERTIGLFGVKQQTMLRNNPSWPTGLVAGTAEELPIASDAVDLVVSFAAVPLYSFDLEAALQENLRVLKVGAMAINGPMDLATYVTWEELLKEAQNSGQLSTYNILEEELTNPLGLSETVWVSNIIK